MELVACGVGGMGKRSKANQSLCMTTPRLPVTLFIDHTDPSWVSPATGEPGQNQEGHTRRPVRQRAWCSLTLFSFALSHRLGERWSGHLPPKPGPGRTLFFW